MPTHRRLAEGRLPNYIIGKNVAFGIDIGGQEAVFEGGCADDSRAADRERAGIGTAVSERSDRPVSGEDDCRIGGSRGDRKAERQVIKAAVHAEFRVGDELDVVRAVGRPWRRRTQVVEACVRAEAIRNVLSLIREPRREL